MHGLMRIDGQRLTIEFRLYDLTNPEFRLIASKMFWVEPLADHRRLAHRIADEVVFYQFTGERGIAETKIAYVSQQGTNKELVMIDYDGFNQAPITNLRSTSLSVGHVVDDRRGDLDGRGAGADQRDPLARRAGRRGSTGRSGRPRRGTSRCL